MKLNLGCGSHVLEGWENYDLYPEDNRVKHLDMNTLPYPFPDNYADEILVSHVLEHLYIPIYEVILELYRILKPEGLLTVALPINSNIIVHQRDRFNIYYFNPVLVNPVGAFAIRQEASGQSKKLFYLESVKVNRNYKLVFRKRLGGAGDKIVGYRKDIKTFIKFLPHRVHDMLFNGEIVWKMTAIK